MKKSLTAMLLPLLLTACGVSLPDTIHIDAREPSHHSHRPERDAEGLIRTTQGECLDIHGDDHRSLIRYRCHGQANQLFRWDGRSGTIRQNARCLDVAGGETRDGSRVILFACNGKDNQRWYADGSRIRSAASGKCLDAAESHLAIRACNGSRAQQFDWGGR